MMVIKKIRRTFVATFLALLSLSLNAQEKQKIVDFMTFEDYVIGGESDFLMQTHL